MARPGPRHVTPSHHGNRITLRLGKSANRDDLLAGTDAPLLERGLHGGDPEVAHPEGPSVRFSERTRDNRTVLWGTRLGVFVRGGEAELHVRDARALQRGPAGLRETDTDQPGEDAP